MSEARKDNPIESNGYSAISHYPRKRKIKRTGNPLLRKLRRPVTGQYSTIRGNARYKRGWAYIFHQEGYSEGKGAARRNTVGTPWSNKSLKETADKRFDEYLEKHNNIVKMN